MMIGVFGNLSQGKTALVYWLLLYLPELNEKKYIFTNSETNLKKAVIMNFDEIIEMSKNNPKFFQDSVLFIDEIHWIVDARRANSTLNVDYTQFLTQLGKIDCVLIYTSQIFSSQIDLRLREMTDIIIFCEKVSETGANLRWKRIEDVPIFIDVEGYVKRKAGLFYTKFRFRIDPQEVFASYNTRQMLLLDRGKYLKQ